MPLKILITEAKVDLYYHAFLEIHNICLGFPGGSGGTESAYNVGDRN